MDVRFLFLPSFSFIKLLFQIVQKTLNTTLESSPQLPPGHGLSVNVKVGLGRHRDSSAPGADIRGRNRLHGVQLLQQTQAEVSLPLLLRTPGASQTTGPQGPRATLPAGSAVTQR